MQFVTYPDFLNASFYNNDSKFKEMFDKIETKVFRHSRLRFLDTNFTNYHEFVALKISQILTVLRIREIEINNFSCKFVQLLCLFAVARVV